MKTLISRIVPLLGLLTLGTLSILPPAAAQTVTKKPFPATSAARKLSMRHMKGLATMLVIYTQDHNAYPPMQTAAIAEKSLAPYARAAVDGKAAFIEPGANKLYLPNPLMSGIRPGSLKNPGGLLAFYESVPAADGSRVVCTADGQVATLSGNLWPAAKRAFRLP